MDSLVEQDPQAKIRTTSAKSETTQTTTVNSTIFDNNRKRITFQSTRQTTINCQTAGITEITTWHTPNPKELEEMLAFLNMNDEKTETNASTSSASTASTAETNKSKWRQQCPNDLAMITRYTEYANSVPNRQSSKCTDDDDLNKSPVKRSIFTYDVMGKDDIGTGNDGTINESPKTPKTPTVMKISETNVTQKNYFTFTQRLEEQNIKLQLSPTKPISTTRPTATTTKAKENYKFQYNDYKTSLGIPTPVTATVPHNLRTLSHTSNKKLIATLADQTNKNSTLNIPTIEAKQSASLTTKLPYNSFMSINTIAPLCIAYNAKCSSFNTPTMVASGKMIKGPVLKPGYAYIFNNLIFNKPENEQSLSRAKDVKTLKETFEYFKLNVKIVESDKLSNIRGFVEKVQNKNFNEEACLVIAILNHGLHYEEIHARDVRYSIDDNILLPILKNSTLSNKPKLFFVQGCKRSAESRDNDGLVFKDAIFNCTPSTSTPNEVLKCYSTLEEFQSYHSVNGSMFMQVLCQNLKLFGCTKSINDIMELVIKIVKQQSEYKQIAAYTSTLTKPFVFGDYVKWCK